MTENKYKTNLFVQDLLKKYLINIKNIFYKLFRVC